MTSISGIITNIQRCSTEDGPGIRTTVFMKGCPLRCSWCHNIETINAEPQIVWYVSKCIGDEACIEACLQEVLQLTPEGMQINRENCIACGSCVSACPTGAIKLMGETWDANALVEELIRDKTFFETSGGGVTISGGEPTFQADFVTKIASGLREQGIHVALDTCGYCSENVMEKLLEDVDMVLYDLKQMDPVKHEEYTGVPLERVLQNACYVASSGKTMWVRTPVIPGHTDSADNIRAIADFIVKELPNAERYDLLAFNKMCLDKYALFGLEYPLKDYDLMSEDAMDKLCSIATERGVSNVHWSGMTKHKSGEKSITIPNKEVSRCD